MPLQTHEQFQTTSRLQFRKLYPEGQQIHGVWVIIPQNLFLPPSLFPKGRVGPWLVVAVSIVVGAALVAAVEVNDPKVRPGTKHRIGKERWIFTTEKLIAVFKAAEGTV